MNEVFVSYRSRNLCVVQDEIQLLVTGMALGLGEPSKLTKYKRKIAAPLQTKESRKLADDELIFSLEEEHVSDLSQTQSLTFPVSGGHQFSQTGSLKLKNKSPTRSATRYNSVRLSRHVIPHPYLVHLHKNKLMTVFLSLFDHMITIPNPPCTFHTTRISCYTFFRFV